MIVENGEDAVKPNSTRAESTLSDPAKLKRRLSRLVQRAAAGNQAAVRRLRALLQTPEGAIVVECFGNLAAAVEQEFITECAAGNPIVSKVLRIKLRELHERLAGPAPSHLERLLVERV